MFRKRHVGSGALINQPNHHSYSYIDATIDFLGGTGVLGTEVANDNQLLLITRAGLPRKSLQHLVSVLEASPARDAATIAWLRSRLTGNDDSDEKLDFRSSEMTLRVATLLVALIGLFEDLDPAIEFLLDPHAALDGLPPAKAVFTTTGVAAVNKLVMKERLGLPT